VKGNAAIGAQQHFRKRIYMLLKTYQIMSFCVFVVAFALPLGVLAQPAEGGGDELQESDSVSLNVDEEDELELPGEDSKENPEPEGEKVPFNIGLFPYANINAYKTNPHNNFSLDLVFGLNHTVKGAAIGALPVVLGDMTGLHAGMVNVVMGDTTGFQVSGVNVDMGNMTGFQMGFFNVGMGKVRGLQMGLINYADEIGEDSATVGLINYARKGGRRSVSFWTSDVGMFNVGTRTGGNHVYGIWAFSLQPKMHPDEGVNDSMYWGPGVGIGFNVDIVSGWSVSFESITFALFDNEPKIDEDRPVTTAPQTMTQLLLLAFYQVNDLVGVFAGPAINISFGNKYLGAISYLGEGATFKEFDVPPGQMGIGFVAGVKFF
jgi:hypothetical protein